MTAAPVDIAVAGAAGLVGEAILEVLAERRLPLRKLHLLGGGDSIGRRLPVVDAQSQATRYLPVVDAAGFDFAQVRLVLAAVPAAAAADVVARAVAAGCAVVDVSARHRLDAGVPLVVAGVDASALERGRDAAVVAMPGWPATMLSLVLAPLARHRALARVHVVGLQSASAAGRAGVAALARQAAGLLNGTGAGDGGPFGAELAFGLLPAGGDAATGSGLEHALGDELRRVLGIDLALAATCLQAPWFHGEVLCVRVEFAAPADAGDVRRVLEAAPRLRCVADPASLPSLVADVVGSDVAWVSRLRAGAAAGCAVDFCVMADNVRGAAISAVEVAERLLGRPA